MTTRAIGTSNSTFPASITSNGVDNTEPLSYVTSLCPSLGTALRDAFYLPWYKKPVASCLKLDQKLAQKAMQMLQTMHALSNPGLKLAAAHFSVRDMPVYIEGKTFLTFNLRLFESTTPISGRSLRVVLFSFNANTQATTIASRPRRWDPITMKELSDGPLSVLRALRENGIKVDSLVTASLGNVTFDGLKHFPTTKEVSFIPSTIVVNRGMTSVRKIADRLYPVPANYFLYYLAKFCGWDANPEQELLNFLKRKDGKKRVVIIIEAMMDYYFADKGRFDLDYHKKIIGLGAAVFRANFFPFPFQVRSHHSLSLEYLENNDVTEVVADTISLHFTEGDKMSSVIAREVFLKGKEKFHTCFYVAGNDATLDIGGIRDVVPLLAAFVEEGRKLDGAGVGWKKQKRIG